MINNFEKNFDYGSFLPLLLFVLGFYTSFLFVMKNFSLGFFMLILAFVVYVINNILINIKGFSTVFNEYLEDMGTFLTFGVVPVIFGFLFYRGKTYILVVVFFYSICQVLGLARNWVLRFKNSRGWPAPLNGLFFPLTYYVYLFYLQGAGSSIFVIYYLIVGILSVSEYNFLGHEENNEKSQYTDLDNMKFRR